MTQWVKDYTMAKSYIQLKNELLASGHLFRDTEFPPLPTSIRKDGQVSRSIVWRRPRVGIP